MCTSSSRSSKSWFSDDKTLVVSNGWGCDLSDPHAHSFKWGLIPTQRSAVQCTHFALDTAVQLFCVYNKEGRGMGEEEETSHDLSPLIAAFSHPIS